MPLLPSKPDVKQTESDPEVVGLEDESEVFTTLRSETARTILTELYNEPSTVSEVADRTETSIQNAQYHVEKLHDTGLVEIVDTGYSSKGKKMNIYAPTGAPLTVVIGDTESVESCQQALDELDVG